MIQQNTTPDNNGTGTWTILSDNPYKQRLRLTALHKSTKPGNVKAFASIRLGECLTIHSIKIIQQPGQRAYVRFPQQQSNGKWFPVVDPIDERFNDAVSEIILDAWRDQLVFNLNSTGNK